jgi:hypothetical protein
MAKTVAIAVWDAPSRSRTSSRPTAPYPRRLEIRSAGVRHLLTRPLRDAPHMSRVHAWGGTRACRVSLSQVCGLLRLRSATYAKYGRRHRTSTGAGTGPSPGPESVNVPPKLRALVSALRQPSLCALRTLDENSKRLNARRSDERPEPSAVELGAALEIASCLWQVAHRQSVGHSLGRVCANAPRAGVPGDEEI